MGKCYIIDTPFGNFGDISLRALEVMNKVHIILCEDLSRTEKKLAYFKINKPLISYREQKHNEVFPQISMRILKGESIALLSDGGSPVVGKRMSRFIRDLHREGVEIISVPGANPIISALSLSGLPTDTFTFLGYFPTSSSVRERLLNRYMPLEGTIVLIEKGDRVERLLTEVEEIDPMRYVVVVKDLTTEREERYRGIASTLTQRLTDVDKKSEYIVSIARRGFLG